MPIYEYRCREQECGAEYEQIRSFSGMDDAGACPTCGSSTTERKVSMSFAVVGGSMPDDMDMDFGGQMDHAHDMGGEDDFDFGDF